jgi:hypothetical protein
LTAEKWIHKNRLTGTLTQYPLDVGIYDWAIDNQFFYADARRPKYASFSSANSVRLAKTIIITKMVFLAEGHRWLCMRKFEVAAPLLGDPG